MKEPLVSIVMPLYNCEKYLADTLESVLAQTYLNWELVIVDDCSTDNSLSIANRYANTDIRIKIVHNDRNRGAAYSRNCAIDNANGVYIAFLDSDDLWDREKLEKQIAFMSASSAAMCCTSYKTIEEDGTYRNTIKVPQTIDYNGFLKNTITCSHTMIIDLRMIDKANLLAPIDMYCFDFPEDMAVWLQILSNNIVCFGLNEPLAMYRKRTSSRSASIGKAIKRTWNQYRKIEKLSWICSLYCLGWQLFHAVLKRIKD